MKFRWLWRLAALVIFGLAAGVGTLVLRTSPDPLSRSEIRGLATGLNEAAAIGVPHGYLLGKQGRAAHAALLAKVEAGVPLDAEESREYRRVFQKMLHDSQGFLSRFDAELTVLDNHAPEKANNISAHGIAGQHDHHDMSARRNFAALLENLAQLPAAGSSFQRIRLANVVQKDLVDLISHLGVAPHTVSVPYAAPDAPWADSGLGQTFEDMVRAFKSAQFHPVHAPGYWTAVDIALKHYTDLIFAVQERVHANTAPFERRIAGRFLSPQTLAPPVDLNRPLRRG